ncbi:hypothetical protein AAH172_03165 [Bacteroides xylanisolvens]|jgi:hypothetical protein|uniref:hypothetical protein n=1 Tax=Bacteroides xylanisolvens TaxID=371601 RepID=UPI0022E4F505|nr:hypothetical protein [Bacteroides xylanisolvens]
MNKTHFNYIIAAPSYDPNSGGSIVLHKLCDLLNAQGEKAMLCPMDFCDYFLNGATKWQTFMHRICHPVYTRRYYKLLTYNCRKFETNPLWNTPIVEPVKLFFSFGLPRTIVVYPEMLSGNMLGAKNVVRYFMHNPGHFTGKAEYGQGELYIRYSNSFARNYVPQAGSKVSSLLMTISVTPSCYNREGVARKREGTAYIVRKGKGKKMVHDMEHSILLDGKSHEEVASILKRVERLVSYDPVTAYSSFALLCGCPSVIVLGDNETPSTYHPDTVMRRMFAYAMDDQHVDMDEAVAWAEKRVAVQNERNEQVVKTFIIESQAFFQNKR